MSRPYLNALNVSYTSPTFSIDLEYLRLRGGGTVSITGLSSSPIIITATNSYSQYGETFSFALSLGASAAPGAVRLGTSSQYLYNGYLYFEKLGGTDSFTFSN